MTATRSVGHAPATTDAGRDPFWDGLRFLAIALVVVGHSIESTSDSTLGYVLYLVIYAFHMPLFAFVSGYFARAEPLTTSDGAKIVRQLLAPYVVFSLVWAVMRWRFEGSFSLDLTSPYWHLWFLTALAFWRIALPVLASFRWPVTVSVVVAVAAGYFGGVGWMLDLARTAGMLPFFVLGWSLRQRGLDVHVRAVCARTSVRVLAAAALAAAVVASLRWSDLARQVELRRWFQSEVNYEALGAPEWWAGGAKLAVLAVGVLGILAMLSLCPSRAPLLARFGRRTMVVYLLHLFPIYLAGRLGMYERWEPTNELVIGLVVAALVWTLVLATRPVEVVFGPVVAPRLGWLLRSGRTASPTGASPTDGRPSP